MARVAKKIRVASNPRTTQKKKRSNTTVPKLTGKKKAAFLARMAKGRKASHRNPSGTSSRKNKRRNPGTAVQTNPKRKNKRRNPETLRALIGSPKSLAIQAFAGLGSAVATRQLPQLILKHRNSGWKGYAANAGAGAISVYAASRLAGPEAAKAALVGAVVIILDRVLTEQYSPLGQYLSLSGSGDATATGTLGSIADGYYIHPTVIDAAGRPVIPHEVSDAAIQSVLQKFPQIAAPQQRNGQQEPPPAALQGTRFRNRFQSRF